MGRHGQSHGIVYLGWGCGLEYPQIDRYGQRWHLIKKIVNEYHDKASILSEIIGTSVEIV
jgi:hypothetical protein